MESYIRHCWHVVRFHFRPTKHMLEQMPLLCHWICKKRKKQRLRLFMLTELQNTCFACIFSYQTFNVLIITVSLAIGWNTKSVLLWVWQVHEHWNSQLQYMSPEWWYRCFHLLEWVVIYSVLPCKVWHQRSFIACEKAACIDFSVAFSVIKIKVRAILLGTI